MCRDRLVEYRVKARMQCAMLGGQGRNRGGKFVIVLRKLFDLAGAIPIKHAID